MILYKIQGKATISKPSDCIKIDLASRIQLHELKSKVEADAAESATQKILKEMQDIKDFILPLALREPDHIKLPIMSTPMPYTPIRAEVNQRKCHKSHSPEETVTATANVDFPALDEWLSGLDKHLLRGRDNQNYARFSTYFIEEGFLRLDDITGLTGKEICDMFKAYGINLGTANRLVRWAKEDAALL